MSPAPPAFLVMAITTPTEDTITTTERVCVSDGVVVGGAGLVKRGVGLQHTSLENEKPLQLMRWSQQDWKLNSPKDQMRYHLLSSDANGLRDMIGDIEIRRPDGTNHLGHCGGTGISLDCVPEESSDSTDNDCEAREVPAK